MDDRSNIVEYASPKPEPSTRQIPIAHPYVEPPSMTTLLMTCLVIPVLIVVGILAFLYFNLPVQN